MSLSLSGDELKKLADEREAELRGELKRKLRLQLIKEAILGDQAALLDTAIGVNRTKLVADILRELADEFEKGPQL